MIEADVAVVGGGPGGYVCGIRAAQLGLKTVVIEADRLGGECVNYGCIPSKSLITISKLADKVKEAEKCGLKASGVSVGLVRLQNWKGEVISRLVGGIELLLKGYHATILKGEAEVVSKDSVIVTTDVVTEAKAVEAGYKVKSSRFQFAPLGRALAAGEPEGFVKVISNEEDGFVLGVQIVGPEASDLISEVALAIEMGATVDDIALTIHPHPSFPEAIMEAAELATGRSIHQLRS